MKVYQQLDFVLLNLPGIFYLLLLLNPDSPGLSFEHTKHWTDLSTLLRMQPIEIIYLKL